MTTKISISALVLVIMVFYVTSCSRLGSWLVKEDESLHSDVMLILMGSIAGRVLQAADIYARDI